MCAANKVRIPSAFPISDALPKRAFADDPESAAVQVANKSKKQNCRFPAIGRAAYGLAVGDQIAP